MFAALAGLIAACGEPPHEYRGSRIEPPLPLLDVVGTNWDGSAFSLKDVRGELAIVFFGYTHCPDVCPMTLAKLKSLRARLGERADDVSVVLVSVDPDRDTVSQLKEYISGFDTDFYGVHVTPKTVASLTESWGIFAERGTSLAGAGGWYPVDHTGSLYVLGPERQLQLRLPQDLGVEDMLSDIEALLGAVKTSAG